MEKLMITQIETSNTKQDRSSWQKFSTWLNDIILAIDYDPHADSSVRIGLLSNEVRKLDTRLKRLEGNGEAEIVSSTSCQTEAELA